ncbi:hypothetical protein CDS [Bradyrhizobium sp.]|nr:hypothetical protein CDS [Bradyrhizobium sp.]
MGRYRTGCTAKIQDAPLEGQLCLIFGPIDDLEEHASSQHFGF